MVYARMIIVSCNILIPSIDKSKPMMMRKSEEDIAEKNLTGNDIYEGTMHLCI